MGTIGAFIMRREFGGIFYHNYNREPPQGSIKAPGNMTTWR